MDVLVDVAKVVTELGSLPVAIALVVARGGLRCVAAPVLREAVALVAGLALTYAAVHITKDAVDRPRPAARARRRPTARPTRRATPPTP